MVEVLEVVLVQRVAHNLDIQLVQILVAKAALEVGRQRRLDQHAVVQLLDVGRHAEDGHRLEPAQRVAPVQQLARVALVEGASDEEGDIVDHVAICYVVHELGEGPDGVGADVAELGDELLCCLGCETRGRGVRGESGEEVAVGGAELELEICS